MEIILIKDVENLGYADQIVNVKPGYANNFLIPQGYAKAATASARKVLAENIKQRAHKEAKLIADAEALAAGEMTSSAVNAQKAILSEAYRNYLLSYVSIDRQDSQKNTTRSTSIEEELTAGFRNDWFEFELNGSLEYEHSRNKLQPNSNLDTWEFAYGFNSNVRLPWGTEIAFDLNMNSRRGYSDESLNTNELIWNAQVSQSFLKEKNLIVTLQLYDLLHQQSNFSRTINAMQRSDTEYNAITSFGMLHVIYRLNLFGSKEARQSMQQGPRRNGPRGGMGPRGPRGGGGFGGPSRF